MYDALIECHQNGDNEYIQRYLMKNCNIIHATTKNVSFNHPNDPEDESGAGGEVDGLNILFEQEWSSMESSSYEN